MENAIPKEGPEIAFNSPFARWVIRDVLMGKRGGYFIEAGASAGGQHTVDLETHFDWTGILVEPHAGSFELLKTRRHCVLENCCLAAAECELDFLVNHNAPATSGIPSAFGDGIGKAIFGDGAVTEMIRIKSYPLVELLRKHGAPKRIDYLCLDIEGAEWLVLKDFRFDEYTFSCMIIERGSNDYLRVRAKLLGEGYRLVRVGGADDYWIHPSIAYSAPLPDVLNARFRRLVQPIKARSKALLRLTAKPGLPGSSHSSA